MIRGGGGSLSKSWEAACELANNGYLRKLLVQNSKLNADQAGEVAFFEIQ